MVGVSNDCESGLKRNRKHCDGVKSQKDHFYQLDTTLLIRYKVEITEMTTVQFILHVMKYFIQGGSNMTGTICV